MEEFTRYERCLDRLRKAASGQNDGDPGAAANFQELLRNIQELRRQVALLTMEAKEKLSLTRATRDRLKDEIPNALSLVAPHQLGEFHSLSQDHPGLRTPIKFKTPFSGKKRLNRDGAALVRKLIDREAAGNMGTPKSPRVRTPGSARKVMLSRSLLSQTPRITIGKKTSLSAIKLKFSQSPSSTPQMPTFMRRPKVPLERKSATKTLIAAFADLVPPSVGRETQPDAQATSSVDCGTPSIPTSSISRVLQGRSVGHCISTAQSKRLLPAESAYPLQSTMSTMTPVEADKATPEMKTRVVFFNNPNIENIHQRYVAIQDSEELTCLLPKMAHAKRSSTPERPATRLRQTNSGGTPTLPLVFDPTPKKSVTPDMPIVRRTPATGVSTAAKSGTGKKLRRSRTPSPPRCASRVARLCLASKLNDLPSGQDERELEAVAVSTQQDVGVKIISENYTPERPSRLVTFKPRMAALSNTVAGAEAAKPLVDRALETSGQSGVLSGKQVSSISECKTDSFNQCLKRTLTKTPLLDVVGKAKQGQLDHNFGSKYPKEIKPTTEAAQEARCVQEGPPPRRLPPVLKGFENKLPEKRTARTPMKCADNRTLFKTPAKTTHKNVPSVSLRKNEKLRSIRPSKMQRQTAK